MAGLRLTEETKKILRLARSEGINIKVKEIVDDYFAYAYRKKDFMDCLREFDKKILLSTLTMDEYAMNCINDLNVLVIKNNQEEACRGVLEKFRNQEEKRFRGALCPFFETGCEGIIWSLQRRWEKRI